MKETLNIQTATSAKLSLSFAPTKVKVGTEYITTQPMIGIVVDAGPRKKGVCAVTIADALKLDEALRGMIAAAATGKEAIR